MKKIRKISISLLISIISIFILFKTTAFANTKKTQIVSVQKIADGASWSDESYDDTQGWGYDSRGYEFGDYYNDYEYEEPNVFLGFLGFLGIGIVMVIILVIVNKKIINFKNNATSNGNNMSNGYATKEPNTLDYLIENKVKKIDPDFSKEDFLSWAKDVFVKLQYAWSDRDLDIIRCFETPQLFEHHSTQIQGYIDNNQINKLEKVSINWAKLLDFKQDGSRDVLYILINTKMLDYIINEQTGKIIKGSNTKFEVNTYKLTFIRSSGVKTIPGTTSVNVTNCPNCGAPVQITSSGKCSYCGSVITTGNFSWVLSNMETYTEPIDDWVPYNDGNIGGFGAGFISATITAELMREVFRPRPYFGGPMFGPGPHPPRRGPRR